MLNVSTFRADPKYFFQPNATIIDGRIPARALPDARIKGTSSILTWEYMASVDARDFTRLLATLQANISRSGVRPAVGQPYLIASGPLQFFYALYPDQAAAGIAAFEGAGALLQWFGSDGGSNLVSGIVHDAAFRASAIVAVQARDTYNINPNRR